MRDADAFGSRVNVVNREAIPIRFHTDEVKNGGGIRLTDELFRLGNAEGSRLRLSLGCLLAGELRIGPRRVGSGKRLTFCAGEERLSEWMDQNARALLWIGNVKWISDE